jgi:hypothetical protein
VAKWQAGAVRESTIAKNLALRAALHEARKSLRGVEKADTARVTSKKGAASSYTYKFTSSEDMVAACRDALHEQDVSCELVSWEVGPPLEGMRCPTLWSTFEVCHIPSGETEERRHPMPIASNNDADKAIAGAITYTYGQAFRALLTVPKVSDKDANDPERRRDDGGRGWEPRAGIGGDSSPEQQAKAEARVAKAKADAAARKGRGDAPTSNGAPTTAAPQPSGEAGKDDVLRASVRALLSEYKEKANVRPKDAIEKVLGEKVDQPNADQLRLVKKAVERELARLEGGSDAAGDNGDAPDWMLTDEELAKRDAAKATGDAAENGGAA